MPSAGIAPAAPADARDGIPASNLRLEVLLVEDNPVNQKLASILLVKRGHAVTLAGTGLDALDEFAIRRFDLVLMDVQMPGMDGLEATGAMRSIEAGRTGSEWPRHVPIVAMTAAAMTCDRESCLAAGMDDYLTKPIDTERFYALLDRLARGTPRAACGLPHAPAGADDAAARSAADRPIIDLGRMLRNLDHDVELARELAAAFIDSSRRILKTMRLALDAGEADELSRGAHAMRGAVANFHAASAIAAAAAVERSAQGGDLAGATPELARLDAEIERLLPLLETLRDAGPPATAT